MTRDLKTYRAKRDFAKTAEPHGEDALPEGRSFVVQKHAASRLHWDFRLEWQGVLLSWAVTRGPSADTGARRLAVRTEDHPVSYGGFEGTIPKGEYGGGTVMLWDRGTWAPKGDVDEGLKNGSLKFVLSGERMQGGWTLVRMKPRGKEKGENWLLIKEHDSHESEETEGLVTEHMTSVSTGRTMEEIAADKPARKRKAAAQPKKTALPGFRPVQLAKLQTKAPDSDDWLHETKFDGYRCLAALAGGKVRLYTRSGLDWTAQFGALVPEFERVNCRSALIDGEVIAPGVETGMFSALQDRLKHGGALAFMAFDLLELDGKDLTERPLVERKAALEGLMGEGIGALRYSSHVEGQGEEVFRRMCEAGQEGVISKRSSAPYRGSRNGDWLKIKCGHRQEFIICGWKPSDKPGRPFASLVMATREGGKLVYRGGVGTGFGAAQFRELKPLLAERKPVKKPFKLTPPEARGTVWIEPDLVAEVSYAELTADGSIRHGVYQGLRLDKGPKEVRLEEEETQVAEPKAKPKRGKGEAQVAGMRISSPDRLVFEDPPVSKREVAEHYAALAERILPFLKDRPVSLLRCPDGVSGECFFQKHRTQGMPEPVGTVSVETKDGPEDFISLSGAAGLIGCAQMGAIEFHIWGAKNRTLDRPDRLVFDLDPDEGLDFAAVKAGALEVRRRLDALGLVSAPMLSGGKGIHVIAPLKPKAEWETVKLFSRALATLMAEAEPERYVATMSKAERKGRIFIDWLRNERGATAVAPYSLRARPGAKVATPVSWDELDGITTAGAFDIASIRDRIALPCPLREASGRAVTLGAQVLKRLEKQVQEGQE
ncbi:DNA ligase D [Cereibacter changlensis]|uniref:DNA ligase (ATP) n=1 Tax=Cereibacter changlensis TaxID=402884 RepID=A0A4U0YZY1_9RHOB|nr:DNA ligase D [Cereibacter changlensis]TKA96316.1 DNA ligase D [Cereibacter changlensis]